MPRTSLRNFARLVDQAVEALARGRLCKARVLSRNLRAKGRAKFQQRGAFRPLSDLPDECQEALDRLHTDPWLQAPPSSRFHLSGRLKVFDSMGQSPGLQSLAVMCMPPSVHRTGTL